MIHRWSIVIKSSQVKWHFFLCCETLDPRFPKYFLQSRRKLENKVKMKFHRKVKRQNLPVICTAFMNWTIHTKVCRMYLHSTFSMAPVELFQEKMHTIWWSSGLSKLIWSRLRKGSLGLTIHQRSLFWSFTASTCWALWWLFCFVI